MNNSKVYVLVGGSGFIGKEITRQLLAKGHKVYVLTRKEGKKVSGQLEYINWDPTTKVLREPILEQDVQVIHLAGSGVAEKRWNSARKEDILNSRTTSIDTLLHLIKNDQIKASYIAFASAIGYYGEAENVCLENSLAGNDYLSNTCILWEESASQAKELNIPFSIHRIGLVMGAGGGAIVEFIKQIKFHIAGIPGSGKQIYSWIHIQDVAAQFIFACDNALEGVYNATSPNVTTAKKLIQSLAKSYAGWYLSLPAPAFALKIILGEMSVEVLKSCNTSSQKIINAGFRHKFASVESAMQEIATTIKTNKMRE
jgi:uncharacterized protein